jgi:hypothetical protein
VKARSLTNGWQIAGQRGPIVLVTWVGAASGSRAAAAALACAASEPDRAALLIECGEGRPPRPSLITTAGARALEERLNAHLPGARTASRGQICQLSLPPGSEGMEKIAAAIPLVRDSAAVIHLPPSLLQSVLEEPRIPATAVLLRSDLAEARALTALAVRELMGHGLRVAVLKHPMSWLVTRAALLGIPPRALPIRLCNRLLKTDDNKFQECYDRKDEAANDPQTNAGIDR